MLKQSTRVQISRDICVCFTRYLLSSIVPSASGPDTRKPLGSVPNLNACKFKTVAAIMNSKLGTQYSHGTVFLQGCFSNTQFFSNFIIVVKNDEILTVDHRDPHRKISKINICAQQI